MFCQRKIELHPQGFSLPHPLIPRTLLHDSAQATALLDRAKTQADELLSRATEQREAMLMQANQAFWQRAEAQLNDWKNERQAMCDGLERYATTVTRDAIQYLLDEVTPAQRIAALLKQLLASQVPAVKAMLLCHPDELKALQQLLANLKSDVWKPCPDDSVPPQTLVMKTDEGDFRIDWDSMLNTLLANPKGVRQQSALPAGHY